MLIMMQLHLLDRLSRRLEVTEVKQLLLQLLQCRTYTCMQITLFTEI